MWPNGLERSHRSARDRGDGGRRVSVFDRPAPTDEASAATTGPAVDAPILPDEPDPEPQGWDFEVAPTRRAFRPWQRPPVPGLVFAELPLRAIAFLLDLAVIIAAIATVSSPLTQISRALVAAAGPDFDGAGVVTFSAVLGALLPSIAAFTVVTAPLLVYFWTTFRASPGQMALGLFTVTPIQGVGLPWQQALLRWLLLYAPAVFLTGFGSVAYTLAQVANNFGISGDESPSIVIYLLLGLGPVAWYALLALTVARDRRGRGWHDKLAGSVVVRRDGSPS
jgi:uncharacterized RDD family membrane protein YckC